MGPSLSTGTLYCLLQNCSKVQEVGRVQSLMSCNGLESNAFLGFHIIRIYASYGNLAAANQAFDKIASPSTYTWTAIIWANVNLGQPGKALEFYQKMQLERVKRNKYVYVAVLKACTVGLNLRHGDVIHEQLGDEIDVVVGNTLVDMYAKCGSRENAFRVFEKMLNRSVVSWNVIIAGYAEYGDGCLSFELFQQMQEGDVLPDRVTFLSILKACANIRAIEQGRFIHECIIQDRLASDIVVGNTIVDMYAKCGSMAEARKVFDGLPNKSLVSWGAMIVGYSQNGQSHYALDLYVKMQQESLNPHEVVLSSALKACSSTGEIDLGRLIHGQAIKSGHEGNIIVGNSLVDMYTKCGSLEDARRVFESLDPDRVSWNAMISGYAQCGRISLLGQSFESMRQKGTTPDETTFTSIIASCSRAGLVDEGRQYFKSMKRDYGIIPDAFICTCMVDLLGRAGCLVEAGYILQSSGAPNVVGWTSLLGSCRSYGNVELGRRCFDEVVHLDPYIPAAYVLMSNIYADEQKRLKE